MSVFKPWCFALLCAIMLAPACAKKSEQPAASPAGESPAAAPSDGSAAAAPATPATDAPADAPTGVAPSDVPAVAAPAANDGIFKYTITTDIDVKLTAMNSGDNIEILVAMNSVGGQYPVKYDLDCEGDGEFEYKDLTINKKCIYKKNTGKHQIWVRGEIPGMFLCSNPDLYHKVYKSLPPNTIISIDSWGNVPWKSMKSFAAYCHVLNKLPEDSPDLRQVKEMNWMFAGAESWNVSNVTNTYGMFSGASSFNQPLESWDVSNVTNMSMMFSGASSFNQPLEKWNVSNVTDMFSMFHKASSFNQPLEKWNVSNVTSMTKMFEHASSFNQPLEKWNIAKVMKMKDLFYGAKAFSYYPKSWVVPVEGSKNMFTGTKVEAEAKKSPLKTK